MNIQKLFLAFIVTTCSLTSAMQNKLCFSVDTTPYTTNEQIERLVEEIHTPYNHDMSKASLLFGPCVEPGTMLVIIDDTPENIVNKYQGKNWFKPNTQFRSVQAMFDEFENNLRAQNEARNLITKSKN